MTGTDSVVSRVVRGRPLFGCLALLHSSHAVSYWFGNQEIELLKEKRILERRVAELRLVSSLMTHTQLHFILFYFYILGST